MFQPIVGFKVEALWCPTLSEEAAGTAGSVMAVGLGVSLSISQPRDPQTLYNVYLANLRSLDPAVCNDTVGSAIIANVYECLYGYEYPVKPYKLYPQLAADMPKVSEDGRIYTIHLKKGIDSVRAGENDPVIRMRVLYQLGEFAKIAGRLDPDGWNLDDIRS